MFILNILHRDVESTYELEQLATLNVLETQLNCNGQQLEIKVSKQTNIDYYIH